LLAYADGAHHAPYFGPGQSFHYSNTGNVLLGMVVERATGHQFADAVQARVLDPLGLADTFLADGGALPEGTVDGYHLLNGELVNVTEINLSWAWTAGGMVSTAADVARFARAAFDGELVSPESFREMFTLTPDPRPQLAGVGWGMGVFVVPSPNGELVSGGGDGPGFFSRMSRLPDADLTVVSLVNMGGDDGAADTLRDEAIGAVLGSA
jgi:D-alanyl-D-alanine carboxypeptidase